MVGDKIAAHIKEEQVTEKLKDVTLDPKESLNFKVHQRPELVVDIYNLRARGRENQVLMDELANVGEHEIFLGSSGKGTSHFWAAREIQLADQVIKSGATARASVPLVCDLMTDEHGWIVKNLVKTTKSNIFSRRSGGGYIQAYIVNDLRDEPVVCQ